MKPNFWLPIATAFILLSGTVMAQEQEGRTKIGHLPTDPVRDAAAREQLRQINQLRKDMKDLLKEGQTTEVIKILEKLMTMLPIDEDRILLADIYLNQGKSDDAIRVIQPVYDRFPNTATSRDPGARMLYVLALLDKHRWEEAVAIYEPTINANPKWELPRGGPEHTFPNVHFSAEYTDFNGLRMQAHLILGASLPLARPMDGQAEYMLEHLKQALKYNSRLPEAHFVSGLLLEELDRYDEAHKEFDLTAKFAPFEAQAEIKDALVKLKVKEDRKKAVEAQQAALKAKETPPTVKP